jgi:DNA oxidative demethylase
MIELQPGLHYYPSYLDRDSQEALVAQVRDIVRAAPLFVPKMPKTGQPFSVRMSNCGALGWVSDEISYRYQPQHPLTGQPWPEMPESLLNIWQAVAECAALPEACLINFYEVTAKMGLHQDRDEQDFSAPVVSVSLGDTCLFRYGGSKRKDKTQSVKLASGDVLVLGGAARLAFHGVDRIMAGTSTLLEHGGRINLTMRRVSKI